MLKVWPILYPKNKVSSTDSWKISISAVIGANCIKKKKEEKKIIIGSLQLCKILSETTFCNNTNCFFFFSKLKDIYSFKLIEYIIQYR